MSAEVVRLKYICCLGYGDALPKDEEITGDIPVFGSNGQYAATVMSNTKSPAIVIGRKGSYGKVNWTSVYSFASDTTFFVDERFTNAILRWLYWALQTLHLDEGTQEAAVPGLNREWVYEQRVLLPPPERQMVIADYLDHETAHIDALITEKERMLVLLEEKRAALISQAVTRGLEPDVPLKPSGLDWLGDIPAHWEVIRLAYLVTLQGGMTPSKNKEEYWEGDIPWASPKDIKQRILTDTIDHISEQALANTGLNLISPPTLLLVVRGMILAKAIPTTITSIPVTINQDMKALHVDNNKVSVEYLKLLFDGFQQVLLALIEESAHGTRCFRTDSFNSFRIPLPPVSEQQKMVQHLKLDLAESRSLSTLLKDSIALLKERRSALITAAVTGQIDPKEMAA